MGGTGGLLHWRQQRPAAGLSGRNLSSVPGSRFKGPPMGYYAGLREADLLAGTQRAADRTGV